MHRPERLGHVEDLLLDDYVSRILFLSHSLPPWLV
jgi:hypothetical protein